VQKVAVERQTVVGTFFGVELGSKNIIARNGRRKALTVVGFAHAVARIRRSGVKTVHEIEVAAIGHITPHRMGPG
jgi:hypothetical protein